jgi:hypothetical protein
VIAGLFLDYVLLKTKSFVLTSVIGGMGFAFIFWFTNYIMLSPFLQPVSFMGHTLTVPTSRGSSTCAARRRSTCGWSSRARCGPSSARRSTCRWCSAPR